jgi:hypothetical protein
MTYTTIQEQSEFLARRKAELGITGTDYVQANPGGRRTPEKRALLERAERLREGNPNALKFSAAL